LPHRSLPPAERLLLEPSGITLDQLSRVLASIHAHDVDFADLYFQHSLFESWSLEEGIVKSGSFSIDRGVGIRAVAGDKQAYAYSDDISLAALDEAATAVRAIGRQGQSAVTPVGRHGAARALYTIADPVAGLDEAAKVALVKNLERLARARDPRVVQVMASLAGEHETILIARSDGTLAADVRPLVRVSVTVIVEENGRREQGHAGGGGRLGYAHFSDAVLADFAHQAVDQALLNLGARDAPAGTMTVVLGPGWPGFSFTRPSAMVSRVTSIARAPARLPGVSASASPPRASPSSTTARCSTAAARSTSTTRATRRSAQC
jgi:TldD protein